MNFIEAEFKRLAEEYGGNYHIKDVANPGIGRSPLSITTYTLSFIYKDQVIEAEYEFGQENMARIKCRFSSTINTHDFIAEKRSLLLKAMFNRNSTAIEVKGTNQIFNKNIKGLLLESGVEAFANDSQFDPIFTGAKEKDIYVLETMFYLGFKHKESVLDIVLIFFTKFIDKFNGQ